MNLVFLEDEPSIRHYFRDSFKEEHSIHDYDTIEATVQHLMIAGPKTDGVICDDSVLDGSVVHNFDRIRMIYRGPVVLVSGSDFILEEILEVGFAGYIQKPAGLRDYMTAVEIIEKITNGETE